MRKIKVTEETSCLTCAARKFSWFRSGTDNQVRQRQQQRTQQYNAEAKHYLFREGDQYHPVYTLKQGWAICYKTLKNGQQQIVHIALSGDLLGYKTAPHAPIDYSVKTMTPSLFCAFSTKDMSQLLRTDTDLVHNLIALQAKQNKRYRTQLAYIGQAQAKHRMAYFLLHIMARLKRRGVNIEAQMHFPLSHGDIANAIGISPVHLGRVSIELNRQGIIACRNNKLHVKNYTKLKALAEDY